MDFLLCIFIFLIILSLRPYTCQGINAKYLSINNTSKLKGIFSITIILHHISERIIGEGYVLFPALLHVGYMIVAAFFFLSGYGLKKQYDSHGNLYLQKIWKHRIAYLLIVYCIVSVLYSLFRVYIIRNYSWQDVARSFINGNPIASNSWYIIVQIIFYLFFLITYKYVHSQQKAIAVLSLLVLLFNVGLYKLSFSSVWYISNYAFPIGVFWATYKEKIDSYISRHYFSTLLLAGLLFTLACLGKSVVCTSLVSILSIVLLLLVIMKANLTGKIWDAMAKISLEIYLLHAIPLLLFRSDYIYINNSILWTVVVVFSSVVLSYLGHLVFVPIKRLIKRDAV